MPIYQFKNDSTGEIKEVEMKISELDEWKANNPEWRAYFDSMPRTVKENGDILSKVPDGFRDKLKQIKKGSGRGNSIKTV